jgi:hypothetical protein
MRTLVPPNPQYEPEAFAGNSGFNHCGKLIMGRLSGLRDGALP